MLTELVKHIAAQAGLTQNQAAAALGVILNASDRQGAGLAALIFERIPGARTLAAETGAEAGAPSGVIARLIERTPGGRMAVLHQTMAVLHAHGLGPRQIGSILPAISEFCEARLGLRGVASLGDMFGSATPERARSVA